ncbi:hypothetical protein D3C77_446440 [compost metagenome]
MHSISLQERLTQPLSSNAAVWVSKAHLIRFQVRSTERRKRVAVKQQREKQKAAHCQQIRTVAGTGVTRNKAAQQIGISYGHLVNLITDHGIDFPARGKLK